MVSDIIIKGIKTPDGTILISCSPHDFVSHTDSNGQRYAVDGGYVCERISFEKADFENVSFSLEHDFEDFRQYFSWNAIRNDEYKKIALNKLSNEHIKAIIETQKHLSTEVIYVFHKELSYRDLNEIFIEDERK